MDTSKIIRGIVNARGYTVTKAITQWDYGYVFVPEFEDMPATYRLDFSNDEHHGTALPVYCGSEGGEVPEELIDTGKDIYVWFYFIGDGFGKTEYEWRIPNHCKPKTEQDEPTPSQQSSIDQAISVVNEVVETVEQKVLEVDQSAQSAKEDADRAEQARDDAQGYANSASQSASVSANSASDAQEYAQSASQSAQSAGGYALSAQTSAQTASEKADAITGLTATATTLPDGSSATASYDAETGVMSFGIPKGKDGTNGIDGDDGVSPTVTITPITGGHRITITDADGEHSADVMDGTGNVDDVQINGTSIVEDGVANVPIADANNPGVVKIGSGLQISNGSLSTNKAASDQIKAGTQINRPIVPSIQHESAFYGLAKAAGDTTQSASSNAVGNYTDEAKAKIQNMLGFGGFELIKTVELTEDSANIEIDTDEAGNAFRLTEFFFIALAQPSASTSGNNTCYVKNNRITYCITISNVVRPTATNISAFVKNIFVPSSNNQELSVCQIGVGGNTVAGMYWNGKTPLGTEHDYSEYFSLYTTGTAKFGAGTVLMLFGRRK